MIESIIANGGQYLSGVSSKLNYLVNNDKTSTSGKNKKAIDLGIEIISEADYLKMIGE
jgi:DNA ligase (NAD+)